MLDLRIPFYLLRLALLLLLLLVDLMIFVCGVLCLWERLALFRLRIFRPTRPPGKSHYSEADKQLPGHSLIRLMIILSQDNQALPYTVAAKAGNSKLDHSEHLLTLGSRKPVQRNVSKTV